MRTWKCPEFAFLSKWWCHWESQTSQFCPMTQLQHSSESQTSAKPLHLHKIANASPLQILFISIIGIHILTAILQRTTQESVQLHNKSIQQEPKEQSHEGIIKSINFGFAPFSILFFSSLAYSNNLENKTLTHVTSTYESLVCRARICCTRARI